MRALKIHHYLEYAVYRTFEWVQRPLPLTLSCWIGRQIGLLAWLILPRYRALVLMNLRIAAGEQLPIKKLEQLTKETFCRAGANFLASLKAAKMNPQSLSDHVQVRGIEKLHAILTSGQGVVLAMGHMGSWEILTRMNAQFLKKFPSGAVYRPLNNPLMDRLIRRRRASEGTQMFSNRESFHKGAKHLSNGGLLVVLADQRARASGTLAPFFGRLSSCMPLPALLCKRSGSALFTLGMKTTRLGHWEIHLQEVQPTDPSEIKTFEVMEGIQQAMSQSLADGFWFHSRWKIDHRPLTISHKKSDTPFMTDKLKPIHYLLTLPSHSNPEEIFPLLQNMRSGFPTGQFTLLGKNTAAIAKKLNCSHIQLPPHFALKDTVELILQKDRSLMSPYEFLINLSRSESFTQLAKHLKLPHFTPPKNEALPTYVHRLGIPQAKAPNPPHTLKTTERN